MQPIFIMSVFSLYIVYCLDEKYTVYPGMLFYFLVFIFRERIDFVIYLITI